jgi:ketosteroid isomerase-like protein
MNLRTNLTAGLSLATACLLSSCGLISTPPAASTSADDLNAINTNVQQFIVSANNKDLNGIMNYYAPDESAVLFDSIPPRQFVGATAIRNDWANFMAAYPTTMHFDLLDWKAEASGDLGYGHGFVRVTGPAKDGTQQDMTVRLSDVFKKIDGKWVTVHEHVSWPVDPVTSKVDFNSKP